MACEMVSATGSFARRTGAMVGLEVPVIPVRHQYIVTEPHPAIQARHAAGLAEMGALREERGGLILGPCEAGAPACYVDGPAEDCEYELFQEDLERLEPHVKAAIHRVPAFGGYATLARLVKKSEEACANGFTVHYPDEESSSPLP